MSELDVGNNEQAAAISEKLRGIFGELESLVHDVAEYASDEQVQSFRRAIGAVCGSIVLDVLGPLYRSHPEIRPSGWPEEKNLLVDAS